MFTATVLVALAALTALVYFRVGNKITYFRHYDSKSPDFFGARFDKWTVPHFYGGGFFVAVGVYFVENDIAFIISVVFWTLWEVWDAFKTTQKKQGDSLFIHLYNSCFVSEKRFDVIDWFATLLGAVVFFKLNEILL